ncbi:SHOCT domain-containing protein [Kitasatospora purpeofusca]|uniref:SHOCT domain-containing protein n=1 Tax=Kitasatospora purpeofusca TaxID=67352 RepID=UPI002A5A0FA7|nr:SHOCT domain-containing protein [Kitasatospora purpeofusca]MDY0813210.1 SHOCT domain-containing protein [Kitasatospora purpeofusca]
MQSTALLADAYCRDGWGPWNGGGGPGPWFLLFPLFWLIVLVTVFTVFRRRGFARRGPWGPPWAGQWGGPWGGGGPGWRGGPWGGGGTEAPLASLARRYADGEITEEEYRTRRDTLLEHLQGPDDTKPGQGGGK